MVSASSGARKPPLPSPGRTVRLCVPPIDHDEVGLTVAKEVAGDQADRQARPSSTSGCPTSY